MPDQGNPEGAGGDDADPVGGLHLQPADCPSETELAAASGDKAALRRLADQALRDQMAKSGFSGSNYSRWQEDMARYAISVLAAWLYTGQIFGLLRARGYGVKCDDDTRELLRTDASIRADLATMTVAKTFASFRRDALLTGKWRAQEGASLPTYFMGAVLVQFPNVFRSFMTDRRKNSALLGEDLDALPTRRREFDPATVAAGRDGAERILAQFPARTQEVLLYLEAGYHHQEIADLLGIESRAVEGVIYRARVKLAEQYPDRRQR